MTSEGSTESKMCWTEEQHATSWEYLVKWQDYPPENNTWEPWRNLNAYGKKFVMDKGMAPPGACRAKRRRM